MTAFTITTARLDIPPESCREAETILSPDERQRADRYTFPASRTRFIAARASLRRLIGMLLDAPPAEIEFAYSETGKPSLAGRFGKSNLRFNVTHCEDLAVYAFATGAEVGVDVEAIRWLPDADDVATRMFSPAESAAYAALDPIDRPAGFFNCWTRKEAFIKACGDGLRRPLDSFDVSLAPNEPARILRVGDTPGECCGWSLASLVPVGGYVAAVVLETHDI